jgi:hypothetical protein
MFEEVAFVRSVVSGNKCAQRYPAASFAIVSLIIGEMASEGSENSPQRRRGEKQIGQGRIKNLEFYSGSSRRRGPMK